MSIGGLLGGLLLIATGVFLFVLLIHILTSKKHTDQRSSGYPFHDDITTIH